MFSPLENEELDRWFQRLNAPLKRLPTEERVNLHLEVRQHLEALAAANEELDSTPEKAWELARIQFGDPGKFGRRMAWEWWRKRHRPSPDMMAFLFGVRVHFALLTGIMGLMTIKVLTSLGGYFPSGDAIQDFRYFVGIPSVTGFMIGRKHSYNALRGALSTALALTLLPLMTAACAVSALGGGHDIVAAFLGWLPLTCGAAYLASVTKRGWYKPMREEFKITLPSHAKQISR